MTVNQGTTVQGSASPSKGLHHRDRARKDGEELTTDHVNVLGQAAIDLNCGQTHLEATQDEPQSKGSIGPVSPTPGRQLTENSL